MDMRKKLFTIGVARHWHRLPRDVVDAPSLETPKARLYEALGVGVSLFIARGLV